MISPFTAVSLRMVLPAESRNSMPVRNSLATTDGWAIWKGSKHPNECWEFLKFLQSDEWNDLLITVALLRPSRVSLFDKWLTSVQKAVPGLANKNLKVFGDAVPYTTPLELFEFNPEATEIINASIRDAVFRTNSSGGDLATVCKAVASQVNAAEAKAKAAAS